MLPAKLAAWELTKVILNISQQSLWSRISRLVYFESWGQARHKAPFQPSSRCRAFSAANSFDPVFACLCGLFFYHFLWSDQNLHVKALPGLLLYVSQCSPWTGKIEDGSFQRKHCHMAQEIEATDKPRSTKEKGNLKRKPTMS